MGSKTKTKPKRIAPTPHDGPTPERLAKGDHVEMIDAPESDRRNRNAVTKIHKLNRKGSIDYLYQPLGAISYWQWWAADQYRGWMQDGWPEPIIASDYGRSSGGGEPSRIPFPMGEGAEKARAKLKAIRDQISLQQRQCIEAAITGEHDQQRGRARMAQLDQLRGALTAASLAMGGR